ncbi:hypothetical protein [Virgibacillus indicus]|nr:hypothetical protein [Virgibacillus indicus]
MKKILVALFAIFIIGFGFIGYSQMNDVPNEIVDEDNHSTTIRTEI